MSDSARTVRFADFAENCFISPRSVKDGMKFECKTNRGDWQTLDDPFQKLLHDIKVHESTRVNGADDNTYHLVKYSSQHGVVINASKHLAKRFEKVSESGESGRYIWRYISEETGKWKTAKQWEQRLLDSASAIRDDEAINVNGVGMVKITPNYGALIDHSTNESQVFRMKSYNGRRKSQ